jgi:hypothetical protein
MPLCGKNWPASISLMVVSTNRPYSCRCSSLIVDYRRMRAGNYEKRRQNWSSSSRRPEEGHSSKLLRRKVGALRSLCEILLKGGAAAYQEEGPKYVQRLLSRQKKEDLPE